MSINSIMDYVTLIALFLPPIAFFHGYWVGNKQGVVDGAARMWEFLWEQGATTDDKNVRVVELQHE